MCLIPAINYPGIITMTAFVRSSDVEKQVSLHCDWNQVFTEATIVSNGDPLASFVFYVPSMLLMHEPADSIDSTIFIYLVNSRG